jgi:hypothetical protein
MPCLSFTPLPPIASPLLYSTSKTTGLIQLIPDAVSLDGLKKKPEYPGSLRKHFEQVRLRGIGYGYQIYTVISPAFVAPMALAVE